MALSPTRRAAIMTPAGSRQAAAGQEPPSARLGRLEAALTRSHAAEQRAEAAGRRHRQARRRVIDDRSLPEYGGLWLDRLEDAEARDARSRFAQIHDRKDTDDAGCLEFRPGFLERMDHARLDAYHRALPRLAHEYPRPSAAFRAVFYADEALVLTTPAADDEQAAATEQGVSLPAFRAQLWAAIALLLFWTNANVPSVVAWYAVEHRKGIRRREVRRRARAAAGDRA